MVPGDLVERHGVVVGYSLVHCESEDVWPNWWPDHVMIAVEPVTGHRAMWGADADGNLTRLALLYMGPDNELSYDNTFSIGDVRCQWHLESVSASPRTGASTNGRRSSRPRWTRRTSRAGGRPSGNH